MALSIRNAKAEKLARELAAESGEYGAEKSRQRKRALQLLEEFENFCSGFANA